MRLNKHIIISVSLFLLVIVGGSFVYHSIEGWSKIDSIYFTVVTVTTIGYGDLAPITDAGKIFTIFFSFVGVGMGLYFLSLIGSWAFKKHVVSKVTEIKSAVRQQEEVKSEIKKLVSKRNKR
ncbi:MAG TPA: two pore domain potassium channel family protein [Candidatus Pacearchaeota archaeon]|nr:voltage-gated potassium channel [archaeon BMS3Abin17]HDK42108.1 two pore domain potassium channel family protein [Candidatus Pacearchaeota archaeon]HDZ60640.1 two pore domain potassium channel family protein [Candidatus Pacearchaeota archaeon]